MKSSFITIIEDLFFFKIDRTTDTKLCDTCGIVLSLWSPSSWFFRILSDGSWSEKVFGELRRLLILNVHFTIKSILQNARQSECNPNSSHWLSQRPIVIIEITFRWFGSSDLRISDITRPLLLSFTALYHSIDVSVSIIRSVIYPLWNSVSLNFILHVLPVRVDVCW